MKKLVIILPEKAPNTKHICFEGGCPFYQENQPKKSICRELWENNPAHIANPLASLCDYYNTKDVTIVEVESEWLDKILKQQDANALKEAELNLLRFTNSNEALLKHIAKNIIEIKYLLKEQNANRE